MDFKALRAAKNKKAADRINSSGGKVDSSDWTPDEKLDADVKTGMRPISRRAFKTGGKVDGAEAKTNLSRAPRGGLSEKVGLANTDQKAANERREGKKHVGAFKRGGKADGGAMADQRREPEYAPQPTQASMDSAARSNEGASDERALAPKTSPRPLTRSKFNEPTNEPDGMKKGGAAKKKKWEGSPADNLMDAKMAKKRGMTHKEWEGSEEDRKMDAKHEAKGCSNGCTCSKCRAARKDGGRTPSGLDMGQADRSLRSNDYDKPKSYNIVDKDGKVVSNHASHGEAMKNLMKIDDDDGLDFGGYSIRAQRKSGGRIKGKTNIVINVMPHTGQKDNPTGIMPPAAPPSIGAPPPMAPPAPTHIGLPPGLGAAMAGAAGAGPMPGGPGPMHGGPGPMMPPMARKSGGKVYPIHTGAGGGQARLDKIKAYGLKQK